MPLAPDDRSASAGGGMLMLWLRGCPRCGGDLADAGFGMETYVACLQCGKTLTAEQEAAVRAASRRYAARAA